jgi:FdhD protein
MGGAGQYPGPVARGRTETVLVTKIDADGARRGPDELVVEEPLEIRLDDHLVATTMRTPGHDFELAAGLCLTDGLLAGVPVEGVRYCATGSAVETEFNVVTVETGGVAPEPVPRLGTTTSSCGLCGSTTLAQLAERLAPLPASPPLALDVLAGVAERVRHAQGVFAATGGAHAAAAFDAAGGPVVVREDIGRHNAVDKVVGRLLLDDRLPASGLGLFVSGRASFEIVQKAWAAGFAAIVAVSAPSALAVATARAAGIVLVGFAREGRLNVFAPERFAE